MITPEYVKSCFPDFYGNPEIQRLGAIPKWTASTQSAEKKHTKIPVNIHALYQGRIDFAKEFDKDGHALPTPFDTLDSIVTKIPWISNHTLQLAAGDMDCVVLDIESACPDDVKDELLQLPYFYGEHSMSGKGYHLLFHCPTTHLDILLNKVAVKDVGNNGYYELLLNHYVTFTRNAIPLPENPKPMSEFLDLWDEMAKEAVLRIEMESALNLSNEGSDYPYKDEFLIEDVPMYTKTPEDFSSATGRGDVSAYEFGYCGHLYRFMCRLLNEEPYRNHVYTRSEWTYMLYDYCKEYIPYRAKHDEKRQGLPYLLYIAKRMIELNRKETN